MSLRGCAMVLAVLSGCSPALRGRSMEGPAARGWTALADGKVEAAARAFEQALARDPADARALFGVTNLAYERGDDETALGRALDLLEAAAQGDRAARKLAAATLSRLSRVLAEVPDRRPAEARLLALHPKRLPWEARYALATVRMEIARRRGDATLLERTLRETGCVRAVEQTGTGGRLPMLDLSKNSVASLERPRALLAGGCQVRLDTSDGRPGVKVLQARLDVPAGRYELVLDFAGAARLRVDGGAWHGHGDALDVYGPRVSALPVTLAAGKHAIELRLAVYGSSVELGLLAMPAAEERERGLATDDGTGGLATALTANLLGDNDAVLTSTERMAAQARFSLGLAAAARLGALDRTRPFDVTRDKARALWQQAVAVDPTLARVWLDLAGLDMQNERPREALAHALRARERAPGWWPAHLGVATALRAQGLEQPADRALDAGVALVRSGHGGCAMIEKALERKRDRDDVAAATGLVAALERCDAQSSHPRTWAEERGDLDLALRLLERASATHSEPLWVRSDLANLRLARGELPAAAKLFAELVELAPRDARAVLRLADVEAAMGESVRARSRLAEAVRRFAVRQNVRQAARLAGLELPLDGLRVDGGRVVRDFLASGRRYQAPAVVVLDRAVERVFPDGARLMLTHSITQVLSKDAIEHVGEVQVPHGAEVLGLRTRKADGTLREAEEIAGKPSISAPNLGVGDFVESETLEFKEPRDAFAPAFLGERFYFQSFEAPLDRSEYVFVAPAELHLDINRRGGAPAATETRGSDGTRILSFVEQQQPQLFAERAAVPAPEWIPSIRIGSGITLERWSRYVAERFVRVPRGSPELRKLALDIARTVHNQRDQLPEAIVAWVRDHIEPEPGFTEPATVTLARGRGNRAGLIIALARSLGVRADLLLARSRFAVAADAPLTVTELDDFRELAVRFQTRAGERFVDPQLRRAPFGFLHAGIDGAPAVVIGTGKVIRLHSTVPDRRKVELRVRLAADGSAQAEVTEEVSGWPAVEWSEMLDRAGKDQVKLRQAFEQYWLGRHFPGAQLDTLVVEPGPGGTRVRYTFTVAQLADRHAGVLRLRPTFFRAQPGRRFATEPERKTTLAIGYDVPLELDARLVLPAGAKVIDVGRGADLSVQGARFVERRTVAGDTIELRRSWRLPLMRVPPADYPAVAARLRTVDPIEQGELRIAVPE